MRNARKSLALLIAVAALAACQKKEAEQNIAIDNGVTPTNANIETLPADESSATPSNELINGADNADANAANTTGNGY